VCERERERGLLENKAKAKEEEMTSEKREKKNHLPLDGLSIKKNCLEKVKWEQTRPIEWTTFHLLSE